MKGNFIPTYKHILLGQAFASHEHGPADRMCVFGLLLRAMLLITLIINIYAITHSFQTNAGLILCFNIITLCIVLLFKFHKQVFSSVLLIGSLYSIAAVLSLQSEFNISLSFSICVIAVLVSGLFFNTHQFWKCILPAIGISISLFFVHPTRTNEILRYVLLLGIVNIITWIVNEQFSRYAKWHHFYEEKLSKQNDIARVGKMAIGLIHDIANPVTYIDTILHLKSSYKRSQIIQGVRQIALLIASTKKQIQHHVEFRSFSPSKEVRLALQFLRFEFEQKKLIYTTHLDKTFMLNGDPSTFHQCVLNLVSNAIEAYDDTISPPRRRITITLRRKDAYAELLVRDHAHGISEENKTKMFTPFFTTKPSHIGTGIGLSSTKERIERVFHGSISFSSAIGKGTTFRVQIPTS